MYTYTGKSSVLNTRRLSTIDIVSWHSSELRFRLHSVSDTHPFFAVIIFEMDFIFFVQRRIIWHSLFQYQNRLFRRFVGISIGITCCKHETSFQMSVNLTESFWIRCGGLVYDICVARTCWKSETHVYCIENVLLVSFVLTRFFSKFLLKHLFSPQFVAV